MLLLVFIQQFNIFGISILKFLWLFQKLFNKNLKRKNLQGNITDISLYLQNDIIYRSSYLQSDIIYGSSYFYIPILIEKISLKNNTDEYVNVSGWEYESWNWIIKWMCKRKLNEFGPNAFARYLIRLLNQKIILIPFFFFKDLNIKTNFPINDFKKSD